MATSSQSSSSQSPGFLPSELRSDGGLDADVIIVGAGVTGCATAAALAGGRRRILVLEARRGHKPRFAGELIHPTGTQVLAELGFLPSLRRHGGMDIDGFAVVKRRDRAATRLPYSEIPRVRPTGWAMEHRDLVEAMRQHMQSLAEGEAGDNEGEEVGGERGLYVDVGFDMTYVLRRYDASMGEVELHEYPTPFNDDDDEASALALRPDGGVIMMGQTHNMSFTADLWLARLSGAGALER